MRVEVTHQEGLTFRAKVRGHEFMLVTQVGNGGKDQGPSPKEMLLASIATCSGMDVAAILKKNKIDAKLSVSAEAVTTETHPKVFVQVDLIFDLKGPAFESPTAQEKAREAVELSMTKYCGVSAMVEPVSPIYFTIRINDEIFHRGQAKFS